MSINCLILYGNGSLREDDCMYPEMMEAIEIMKEAIANCRPRSVATTLCLTTSFHYLSIIKYRLCGYIIQLVLSGDIVAITYQYRHHRQSFATI